MATFLVQLLTQNEADQYILDGVGVTEFEGSHSIRCHRRIVPMSKIMKSHKESCSCREFSRISMRILGMPEVLTILCRLGFAGHFTFGDPFQ